MYQGVCDGGTQAIPQIQLQREMQLHFTAHPCSLVWSVFASLRCSQQGGASMARGGKHGAKVAPSPNVQAQRQAEVRSPRLLSR